VSAGGALRRAAVIAAALAASLTPAIFGQEPDGSSLPTTQLGVVLSGGLALPAAREAGVRAVKVLADWSLVEAVRGRFDWTALDHAVADAAQHALRPVVVLAHTPSWASVGTGADRTRAEIYSRQPPREVADWERFVAAAAARYRGRVAEWQVWTQIGLPQFRGTGTEYLALLRAASGRLRAADPSARVALAAPGGMDLGFITRAIQDASAVFDAVALSPQGFAPETLLRPLAVLDERARPARKAIWIDWAPPAEGALAPAAAWARLLAVAQAAGVERVYALAPGDLAHLRVAAAVLARPFAGYLIRDPDTYAVVFGPRDGSGEAVALAWATAAGRLLDVPATARAAGLDGAAVDPEVRDGRALVRLGPAPVLVSGLPAALAEEARATAARGPWLPAVPPERDYAQAVEVSARLGRVGEERGLYNLPYRARRNGAVEPVDAGGEEAVRTSVARQVIYVYFDIDDTFLYFAEGRVPLEIVVEVLAPQAAGQVGFNLLYDSTSGYRFTPWQWLEPGSGWRAVAVRLTDATMANTWGWDFAINTAGNRAADLVVRRVTVRKGAR
jgi:hypothetical protein